MPREAGPRSNKKTQEALKAAKDAKEAVKTGPVQHGELYEIVTTREEGRNQRELMEELKEMGPDEVAKQREHLKGVIGEMLDLEAQRSSRKNAKPAPEKKVKELDDEGIVDAFDRGSGRTPKMRDEGITEAFRRGSQTPAPQLEQTPVAPGNPEPAPQAPPVSPLDRPFNVPIGSNRVLAEQMGMRSRGKLFTGPNAPEQIQQPNQPLRRIDVPRGTPEQIEASRKNLDGVENNYLNALAEFHRNRDFFDFKSFGKHAILNDILYRSRNAHEGGIELPREIQELRKQWIEEQRRHGGLAGLDLSLASATRENQARLEGLGRREKSGVEKMWSGYQKHLAKPVRIALGTTVAVVGGGAALAGGGIFLIPAALGAGTALAASRALLEKDPVRKKKFERVSSILSVGGILGSGGALIAEGVHKAAGTREKAQDVLNATPPPEVLSDPKLYEQWLNKQGKALTVEDRIAFDRRAANAAGMVAGGAVLSEIYGAGQHDLGHDTTFQHEHVTISQHGYNDADKAIGHLGEKLLHHYKHIDQAPPAAQELIKLLQTKGHHSLLHGEDHAAIKLGLERSDGSVVVHPHDRFGLTDQGEIIMVRPGHEPHILIDSHGGLHAPGSDWQFAMPHHHGGGHVEHASEAPAQPAPAAPVQHAEAPANPTPEASNGGMASGGHEQPPVVSAPEAAPLPAPVAPHVPEQAPPTSQHAPEVVPAPAPQPAAPPEHITAPPQPVPEHAAAPAPESNSNPTGLYVDSNGIPHAEQSSVDAYNKASSAPSGTVIPYVSHAVPGEPMWRSWISDGAGHAKPGLLDESALTSLPPPQ